jgi:hypothetical protein
MTDAVEQIIRSEFDPQGVNEAERAFRDMDGAARNTGGGFDVLSIAAGNFIADAALQLPGMAWEAGKALVDMGADAEETAGLIQNSLGAAADGYVADMERIAETTNRSSNELLQGSSSILAMSRSMGFAQEEAGKFTSTFANVAVDLGSFFNVDQGQVFEDLQSAMAGSAETMQKYGIDVSVTALETAALNMGLIEQGEKMDRVTKAQVLQSEIMRQATDAMGDAERTGDSFTNQQRKLQAIISDTATEIGKELVPALTPMVTELASFAADVAPKVIEGAGQMVDVFNDATVVFGEVQTASAGLAADVGTLWDGVFGEGNFSQGASFWSDIFGDVGIGPVGQQFENFTAQLDYFAGMVEETDAVVTEAFGPNSVNAQIEQQAAQNAVAITEEADAYDFRNTASRTAQQGYEDEYYARQVGVQAAKDHKAAIEAEAAAAEEAAKAHEQLVASQVSALGTSENLFSTLYQAQADLADAQGEYVDVYWDHSEEIAEVNAQLAGDLSKEQEKAYEDILKTVDEGSAEWLSAYNALQGDLTDSQRAALIAQQAELEAAGGGMATVYTGDQAAAEEAQAAIEAANAAIAQSYRDTAFEATIAQNGFTEATADLAVNLGIMTEEEANARLEFVNTTTEIEALTENIDYLNSSATDQTEAIQLLAGGYVSTAEEAYNLSQSIEGDLSSALINSKQLTSEQIALLNELNGDFSANVTVSVEGLQQLREAKNLLLETAAVGGTPLTTSSTQGAGVGDFGESEAEALENRGF